MSDLIDIVLSWSLEDIFNEDLYKDKVKCIDRSFKSVDHYLGSYVYPLLEETRAQLCSSMEILSSSPFAEVISLEDASLRGNTRYDVRTDIWKNRYSGPGKDPYKTMGGDYFILADFKPETVNDLLRVGKMWTFMVSTGFVEEEMKDANAEDDNAKQSNNIMNFFLRVCCS